MFLSLILNKDFLLLPISSDYVLLVLASLSARVSFIVAVTQELVSTPSCINKNRDTSLARRFPNFKELFLFFRMFAEFTQCGR